MQNKVIIKYLHCSKVMTEIHFCLSSSRLYLLKAALTNLHLKPNALLCM